MRTCKTCSLDESSVNFSGNRRECNTCRGRDYYSRNRTKVIASSRSYAMRNAEAVSARRRAYYLANPHLKREAALRRNYGISLEEYETLVAQRDGRCWICNDKPRGALHVDHCHGTGRVRGALCGNCNTALGMFKDDPERLQAAISYLR